MLVLDGKQAVKRKAEMARQHINGAGVRVVVINYESVWRKPFLEFAKEVEWDAIICDESHRIKSHNASCSKELAKLGNNSARRLCLTGTPMPHSPMDVFGQFRFLDPGLYGNSYHKFRSRYAITGALGQFHIVGFKNEDHLARMMATITYEVDDSVLDLPPIQHVHLPVTLSSKTMKAYRELEKQKITEVKDDVITTANALVETLRLRQLTSGFSQSDGGELVRFDHDKEIALYEQLEGIVGQNEPVAVACWFKEDLAAVQRVVAKLNKSRDDNMQLTYGEISGSRKDLTENAEMPPGIDVLGVQIRSGGVGIDLTRARYAITIDRPWSLGDWEQFLARLRRPGQTRQVIMIHLVAEGTIDERVLDALDNRRDVVEGVLSYMRGA